MLIERLQQTKFFIMATMEKVQFYNMLTSILDESSFTMDDHNCKVSYRQPITWEDVKGLKSIILGCFGNDGIPYHEDTSNQNYKFHSRYIEIDEDTIKLDKMGRLYVDTDLMFTDKNIDKLLNNEDFVKKIADTILLLNKKNQAWFTRVYNWIVTSPEFIKNVAEEVIRQQSLPKEEEETVE